MKQLFVFLLGLATISVVTLSANSAAASDDARCVQQMLADAHYDVGAIDGRVGAKTREAAAMLLRNYKEIRLPKLAPETEEQWCQFASNPRFEEIVRERAALDLIAWRDLEGPKSLWRVHERGSSCADVPRRHETRAFASLKPFDPAVIPALKPIFPPAVGAAQCVSQSVKLRSLFVPKPIVDAQITGVYGGTDHDKFQPLEKFLGPAIATYRAAPSPETAAPLEGYLTSWGEANAMSENIWFPLSEPNPLDFGILSVLAASVIAYSEVGPLMAPDDAEKVGIWLHRLVGEAVKSTFHERQDNKANMRAFIALLWGILTEDQELKQAAYEAYDNALYDLRPDGSQPMDGLRGGSSLHYTNRSAMMLMGIILAASADGQNLLVHEIEGRSFHNAANWVALSGRFRDVSVPYALPCPEGGDLSGYTKDNPETIHMYDGAFAVWAHAYSLNPDAKAETLAVIQPFLDLLPKGSSDTRAGGPLACYAAGLYGNATE